MGKVIAILFALLAGSQAYAGIPIGPEYVSIDCPAGDISLALDKGGVFQLTLNRWDAKLNKHTSTETLSGKWKFEGSSLVLSGKSKLVYKRGLTQMKVGTRSAGIDSFIWVKSSKPTFADKFSLVERRTADELFLSATPK